MKDPVKVRLPSDDRGFVVLRVENARDNASLTQSIDVPLDL